MLARLISLGEAAGDHDVHAGKPRDLAFELSCHEDPALFAAVDEGSRERKAADLPYRSGDRVRAHLTPA